MTQGIDWHGWLDRGPVHDRGRRGADEGGAEGGLQNLRQGRSGVHHYWCEYLYVFSVQNDYLCLLISFSKSAAVYINYYVRMFTIVSFLVSWLKNIYQHRKSCKIKDVCFQKAQLFVSTNLGVTESFLASYSEMQICIENIKKSYIFVYFF